MRTRKRDRGDRQHRFREIESAARVCQKPDRQGGPHSQALLIRKTGGERVDADRRPSRVLPLLTGGLLTQTLNCLGHQGTQRLPRENNYTTTPWRKPNL